MKKALAVAVVALACAAPAMAINLVTNGDFSAGETGWTRWISPWASGTNTWDASAGAGTLTIGGQASFGWVQAISVVPGQPYTIGADWTGNNVQWTEVLFFNDDGRGLYDQLDAPATGSIVAKHDDGALMPNTWGWQSITASPANVVGPVTKVATGTTMYVGLKLGGFGGPRTASFDNVAVTPEPVSLTLLGLGGLAMLRRRR